MPENVNSFATTAEILDELFYSKSTDEDSCVVMVIDLNWGSFKEAPNA